MTTQLAKADSQLATTQAKKPIIPADERGVKLQSFEDMWRFAAAVVSSGQFKDITSPEVALIRIQAGMELGLTPIWSLTNIMVTNGRPSVWGDALLGLVLSHPECEDVIETDEGEGDDYTAVCKVLRKGRQPIIRRFSVADAKKAQLSNRGVHATYPKRMLQMRARSLACRDAFADKLRGLGMVEEVREYQRQEPKPAKAVVLPDEDTRHAEIGTEVAREGEGKVPSRQRERKDPAAEEEAPPQGAPEIDPETGNFIFS